MRLRTQLPIPVKRALHKIGNDMNEARRRRRIPMALMAKRAGISRTTLTKIEKGDPSVSMGIYATVIYILGLHQRLSELVDMKFDETGRFLESENLPRRIHLAK